MKIKDLLTAPRYGIYLPKSKTTTDFEYTDYGKNGFKISTSLELGDDETFEKVEKTLKNYLDKSKQYLDSNDLGLISVLLGATANGLQYVIKFDKKGITLASLITVNAKKVNFIYEKYSEYEYELQLALTKQSSIKFAFSDSALVGDFYFNLKRSDKEDITSITGYTQFHLGNKEGAKPVTLSAGVVQRLPITIQTDEKTTTKKAEKVKHTYIQLQSRNVGGLTIADIVRMVTPDTVEIPDALHKIAIYDFAILKTSGENDNSLAIVLDCHIEINDKFLKTKLTIVSETKDNKKSFSFIGKVILDEHRFDLSFEKSAKEWAILAQYDSGKTTTEINFKKLAVQLFGENVTEQVPEITLNIENFKAFFYYKKQEKSNKLLLGMGANLDIDLKNIPIAGNILVETNALAFKEILAIYSKGDFTKAELAQIKTLPKAFKQKAGLSISAEVVVNGTSEFYTLGGNNKKAVNKNTPQLKKENTPSEKEKNVSNEIASKVSWSKIDKKIGTVNLQRLGLAYDKGKIIALLDASIETNALGMQLMGLGVGFNLDWNNLDPDFYLEGLGLSYKTDTVEIAGALMRTTSNGIEIYNGQARLKVKSFTLSAIGSYAQVNGESSLFIYGLYQGNIGGPPIFHVTAIAAGFGYNRKINAPEIEEVASFPLVALAMQPEDKNLTEVLTSLETKMKSGKTPVEIASGNYWVAVGVKFTSFKIIESFLLLTANFGTKTEFNILGLSRLSWPEKTLRDKIGLKDPIVFVEIALKASFSPDSDVIKIDGLITPNSYVLSKDCKLSGGFAFYTWVSGEHAGDFVMTIGGYHPRFPKPTHYPTVPRIALNWKLDENLLVKGELYFALTPSAIMMGGRWELLYTSSNVRAAFIMWIDILMQWAPFYYDISIGIILRVEAQVKLLFATAHLNLELRAQLDIWGPPFSGKAEIDLGIYSFEICFGSKELPDRKPLLWNEFAKGFLPQDENKKIEQHKKNRLKANGTNSSIPLDCITANVTSGIIDCIEKEGSEKLYIANPMQIQLAIDSAIPVTKLTVNNVASIFSNDSETNKNLGVKPCGFSADEVDFEMNIYIKLGGVNVSNFSTQKITKGYPEALWGSNKDSDSKNPDAPKVISNVMAGLSITAEAPKPNKLQEFDFSTFVEKQNRTKEITTHSLKAEENFNTRDVYTTMKDYQNKRQSRDKIVSALIDFGFDENDFTDFISVEAIYNNPTDFFRGIPKLGTIGHETHNPTDTK